MTDSSNTAPATGVAPIVPDSSAADAPNIDDLRAALMLQRESDLMIAEALATKRSALERAETFVREAEQAAARAEEEAEAAATQRIAAAREEADRLLAEAQDRADQIASDAQAEVTALRRDAADLRTSAQETLQAAEVELERVRDAEAERERQLSATRAEATRMIDALEHVAATLDGELAMVRAEVESARRNLTQLLVQSDSSEADGASPSVVLQWPHQQAPAGDEPKPTEADEATQVSSNPRESGNRRGFLRKTRT